ncbi:MAG: N-acetylmuramic acid 6-phosphate etherase [Planctomycetes bacterium]|nr:N-acetylmuramic acid 6-phosphate etherase [Planctomycetota bacterium]
MPVKGLVNGQLGELDLKDRGKLLTELCNEASRSIDRMSVVDAFDVINAEDASVARAVAAVRSEICDAIELVVEAFNNAGRLIYVGAGTSGRLGVLDASECPPTFLSDPNMVQGIIAGGSAALTQAVEGAEDSPEDGAAAIDDRQVGPRDVVFGISTGGTTPYVHGALIRARALGAKTIFFACVTGEHVPDTADVSIRVLVGPEVIAGSTRLKAGTATKMVLNMVTTISMIRIGKVYGNLMVDVNTKANTKLVDRGIRQIQAVTSLDRDAALALLERAEGHVKCALVMQARQTDRPGAQRLLEQHDGQLAAILDNDN